MKTKILFIIGIAFLLFSGCDYGNLNPQVKKVKELNGLADLYLIEYDSCEYVLYHSSISHKGNCKNCITKNK